MEPRNNGTGGGGQSSDRLYEEISRILEFQRSGLSDAKIDASRLNENDQRIAILVNQIIDLFINEQNGVNGVLGSVVEGSFIADIPHLPGTRGQISERLTKILSGLALMQTDISHLSDAFQSGDLSARIDPSRYLGGFREIIEQIDDGFQALVTPVRIASAGIADFADGKIPELVETEKYQGDLAKLLKNLNGIVAVSKMRGEDINMLISSAIEGRLDARADPTKYPGYHGRIIEGINKMLDAYIGPINVSAEYLDRISKGDIPPRITEVYRGDFNEIKNNLNALIDIVHMRNEDIKMLINSGVDGRLDVRADAKKYPGDNGRMIEGINKMLDAYIGPINVSAEYIDRISKGDIPPKITEAYRGDFNEIKNNLNSLIDVVLMRNGDIKALIDAAIDGNLDFRADPRKYPGENGKMIEGINNMLDAYIGPINVSAEYIDRISKGDIPPRITESYHGDFNEIKNNLNTLIDVVHLRNDDINLLGAAALEGSLDVRADTSKYTGYHGGLIDRINKILDSYLGPINVSAEYIDRISKGDIPPKITEAYRGDFNEIKNNLNSLIDVVLMRNTDIKSLIDAALDGDLDFRADPKKYPGENGKMIEGINSMLDAYMSPINVSAEYIDRISKGDIPPKITDAYRGDFNEIKNNLNSLIDVVLMRNTDIKSLIDAAIDGNLDFRADPKKYPGENGRMIEGINCMLDAYMSPINVSAEYIDRISKGDIPPKITEAYRGDFNEIKNNLNSLIDVVLMRNTDIKALIDAAINGDLDFRADPKKYPGENGKMIEGINDMLDAYIGPINVSAEYIDRISKGDIPPRITEKYHGDFNEIKNNLNTLIDVVHLRNDDINLLGTAAIEGRLDVRADTTKYTGYHGGLIDRINKILDSYLGPINVSAEYIDRISKGDIPPKITEAYRGDFNEIKNNLNALIDVVLMRNTDIKALIEAAIDGNLDFRADPKKYPGENGKMIEGINSMLDAYISPINVSAEYIDRISKGDIPPKITEAYRGDFNEIKNNLNALIDIVHLRNADIKVLIQAALEGKLDVRADPEKYSGENGKMIDGINSMLDAYIGPINVSAEYIDRISKGDIPPKITNDYHGDFNEIKNNLNALIDVVHMRNDDIEGLIQAALEGKLDVRADSAKYHGENGKMIDGINSMLDAYIGPINVSAEYIDRISKGDIPPKILTDYHGDFNEIKNNLNALIDVVHMRNDDIKGLIQAALEGKLDVRADSTKYPGENGKMLDGINTMLDAYIGPINVSAEYIDRISKGDIPPRITSEYHGDFNEIKNNLNALMDVVHMRNTDIQNLIQAAIDGKLDIRADSAKYPGENGRVIDGINSMLDAYIGPINVAAEYIDRISKGDLPPVITEDYHGDFNEIKNNLNNCITTLSSFVRSMDQMYQDQKVGEIDSYLNEHEFIGVYQEMAKGVNDDVRLHVNNILKILGIIVSYAEGDFSPVLETLPGKQIIANEKMDLLRLNLIRLTDDVGLLGKSASEGHLDIRADTSRYHGGFLKIADGFNMTLNAVINPLNLSAEYIDRLSKGDVPPKINDTYYGDFNEIKNNLNALIDVVHMRNADIKMLIQAALDGKLDVRADSAKYPGENGKMLDGINHMLDSYIGPLNLAAEYIDRISKGDLPPKITGEYKGDFNEIKNNLNQCIGAIHLLIDDARLLSDAAVKGDLDVRADPLRHAGDYSQVVTGMNQTMDAVVAPLREAMRISELYSKCDFSEQFDQHIKADGEFSLFKGSLNHIGEEISVTIDKLKTEINTLSSHAANAQFGVEDVSKGAKEISLNAEETSDNAEKAEDGIEQVLQAMSDLTVMVSEISGNADTVARLSEDANDLAKKGTEFAEDAEKGMVSITRSSTEVESIITEIRSEMNQIRKIVNIITDLANQTNLLALNAAIEAARAGDAGRGFAVVASEVKSLAQESRSSAESIADMIQGLERKSDNAAVAIEAAGKAVKEGNRAMIDTLKVFNELSGSVDTINQKMLIIARSTEHQAASFEEITASANEMSSLVKKTADDAIHSSATSEEALSVVSQITDIIDLINHAVVNMHKEMEIFTLRTS